MLNSTGSERHVLGEQTTICVETVSVSSRDPGLISFDLVIISILFFDHS